MEKPDLVTIAAGVRQQILRHVFERHIIQLKLRRTERYWDFRTSDPVSGTIEYTYASSTETPSVLQTCKQVLYEALLLFRDMVELELEAMTYTLSKHEQALYETAAVPAHLLRARRMVIRQYDIYFVPIAISSFPTLRRLHFENVH